MSDIFQWEFYRPALAIIFKVNPQAQCALIYSQGYALEPFDRVPSFYGVFVVVFPKWNTDNTSMYPSQASTK